MGQHEKINYIEFPAKDLNIAKSFFGSLFNWVFEDFGDQYTAFYKAGMDGGFYKSDKVVSTENGSALVVFFSENLEETEAKVKNCGGQITTPIFSFPGGRRFHFSDPNGNEYAVWAK